MAYMWLIIFASRYRLSVSEKDWVAMSVRYVLECVSAKIILGVHLVVHSCVVC